MRGRGGGRGFGRGGGGGWRHRHWYDPVMTKEQELAALKNQVEYLEQALEGLRGRINEVDSPAEGSKTI